MNRIHSFLIDRDDLHLVSFFIGESGYPDCHLDLARRSILTFENRWGGHDPGSKKRKYFWEP